VTHINTHQTHHSQCDTCDTVGEHSMEAEEVTVVVHGARGLQGRKPGRFKFSVIFGVGTKKYRTSVVKEPNGNPDWNEESVVHVNNASDNVFFTVTEKDDVLGQVCIPVASLLTVKGVVKKASLKPHKKCPVPEGDLIFQCYISKQRPVMVTPQIRSTTNPPATLTGFQKLRKNFSPTANIVQKKEEKEERRKSTISFFNKKLSKSIHDIFHLGKLGNNEEEESEKKRNRAPSLGTGLDTTGRERETPVVSHIVPNMASIHGGKRLVLEGRFLGLGKSDIMELMLCDTDLLDTIEFESDSRIYVTTKPTTAGKGDLWIETVSGGQSVIKNVFTFVDRSSVVERPQIQLTPTSEKKERNPSISENGSVSSRGSRGRNTALAESLAESKSPTPDQKRRQSIIPPAAVTPPAKRRQSTFIPPSSTIVTPPTNKRRQSVVLPPSPTPMSAAAAPPNGAIPDHPTVERSASLTQNDRSKEAGNAHTSATLPRLHSNSIVSESDSEPPSGLQDSPGSTGRFRKNFQKHARRASESVVAITQDDDGKKITGEKSDLQAEILRLHKVNEALRKENADYKQYIDGLVARVMIHCPEALAAGPDLKPLP